MELVGGDGQRTPLWSCAEFVQPCQGVGKLWGIGFGVGCAEKAADGAAPPPGPVQNFHDDTRGKRRFSAGQANMPDFSGVSKNTIYDRIAHGKIFSVAPHTMTARHVALPGDFQKKVFQF